MDFILENKWVFLIASEITFFLSMISFFTLRYWFKLTKISFLFFAIFIINDLWLATLAFMDYVNTGELSNYQIIVIVIIVYAFTYGKTDVRRLDRFIQRKVAEWRNEPIPPLTETIELYGKAHAKKEWQHFGIHLIVFAIVQSICAVYFGLAGPFETTDSLFNNWFSEKQSNFPFQHTGANNFTRIWTIILAVDLLITISYTIFPKRETRGLETENRY